MKWMFLAMMVAYLGGNVYIFVRALQQMSGAPMWVRVLFGAIYWLAAVSLFVAMGLRHSALPATASRTLFGIGSAWMVFTLYMVIALIVCNLAHWAMPSLRGGFWIALGVVSTVLAYGYWNYRHPRVVELDLTIDRPIEGGEMRIVAVSDVHLGEGTGRKALSRYVELINAQKPDAVLIAGDLIDNSVVPVERDSMCEEFEAVEAPIYMAAGNHEYISGLEQVEKLLAPTPIHLLRDSIVTLPNGVQLIGRDDRSNRRREPLSALIAKADTTRPIIVLDHQPYHLAEADSLGIDLQISGHTHRGQVWPLNLLTDHLYEQSYGYRRWSRAHIYVSSGLSLWGPPFRIGTQSELVVIRLKNK